jgi:hypothetical protein
VASRNVKKAMVEIFGSRMWRASATANIQYDTAT